MSMVFKSRVPLTLNRALLNSARFSQKRSFSSSFKLLNAANTTPKPKKSLIKTVSKWLVGSFLFATIGGTGYVTYSLWREANPAPQQPQSPAFPNGSPRKTLVILGSGWGSITLLKHLDTSKYNVIVVSPRNYFLYTPLLPSAPVGTVELKSIVEPVRAVARRTKGEVRYYQGEAIDVDVENKTVKVKSSDHVDEPLIEDLKYDYLVVGVGAQPNTFGTPGVYEHASFLKEISDAQEIRGKIMNSVAKAAILPPNDPERQKLLNFIVVGGGPTGVEFAAELKDYIDQDLSKWMPQISKEIKVILVEATPNILGSFEPSLIQYAKDLFKRERIHLKLKTAVKGVDDDYVTTKCGDDVEKIPYGVLVWATGNAPREVSKKLMEKLDEQDSRRGLLINEKLQLLGGNDSIFAVGDCTFHPGLFPTAQVAHQESLYLGEVFNKLYKIDQLKWEASQTKDTSSKQKLESRAQVLAAKIGNFKYNHMGALAYIGSEKAVADLAIGESKYSMSGSFTFLFWKYAYLSMCLSFRNKVLVAMDWIKVSILGRNSSV
ncbi:hypothetical protein Kpol_1058p54 [Vanderwaltozyma polyspora DSM 70294]|uniref:NADH:ubiquinone reductase (non-electrogenic) n=1 Tax=Vanderwaltozyma polyspora (strain ATCC 22028 / DSM 70294 / BCRC 21397 / CBS 2163 / NBRC 10782 / NRRL Y-8283 / UCD 57-17) TaxID=436907 RepID=A7TJT8_VANPO|nr:uncharacterized protein Kpol_1058p54 [Vanderwaltozyma polyspora DSM 70294]EDO17517.1 hypothetical protein Kpol_1058p54 [Vanderwaltozyma polyspora DSM 70294]